MFLAFRYNPQALQMVSPLGARRHNGVVVVPQLEHMVAETSLLANSFFFGSCDTVCCVITIFFFFFQKRKRKKSERWFLIV